jgi:hypothetical protein
MFYKSAPGLVDDLDEIESGKTATMLKIARKRQSIKCFVFSVSVKACFPEIVFFWERRHFRNAFGAPGIVHERVEAVHLERSLMSPNAIY